MLDFKKIVYTALERNASDLHLTVGLPPVYRIDGQLVNEDCDILQEEDVAEEIPAAKAVSAPVIITQEQPKPIPEIPSAPMPDPDTELLKRFSYDALVSEIRRTVRQELETELGQRRSVQPAATPAAEPAPQPISMDSSFDDLFTPTWSPRSDEELFTPAKPEADSSPAVTEEVSSAVESLFDDLFVVPDEPAVEAAPAPQPTRWEEQPAAPQKDTKVVELSLDDLMNLDD